MLSGYEQVRSGVCALVGDKEGAHEVRLVLPETGVCSTDAVGAATACCGTPAAQPVTLELKPRGARAGCC